MKRTFFLFVLFSILVGFYHYLKFKEQRICFNPQQKSLNIRFDSQGSGIGNRIKMLISYTRYYSPQRINLYWPDKGWVTARFSDLFDAQELVNINEINDSKKIKKAVVQPCFSILFPYIRTWALLIKKDDFKTLEPFSVDLQYHKIPQEIKDIYIPYFKKLKPSSAVKKRIQMVKLPEKTIAVQVRYAPDWEKYFGYNEPLHSYFKAMDKYPSSVYFYLSAMSKDVANKFYDRYPGRIIELPNKDYSSMVDAVSDMFILGSTDEAIYYFHSTFSEVAWWLGGAKTKVTTIGSIEHFKRRPSTVEIMDGEFCDKVLPTVRPFLSCDN